MPKGGPRKGAGRRPGVSKVTLLKRTFQEYFDESEVKELMKIVKKQMKEEPRILQMVVEQLFGKAPQRLEVSGKDGEKLLEPLADALRTIALKKDKQ